jgi:hypothetical protein
MPRQAAAVAAVPPGDEVDRVGEIETRDDHADRLLAVAGGDAERQPARLQAAEQRRQVGDRHHVGDTRPEHIVDRLDQFVELELAACRDEPAAISCRNWLRAVIRKHCGRATTSPLRPFALTQARRRRPRAGRRAGSAVLTQMIVEQRSARRTGAFVRGRQAVLKRIELRRTTEPAPDVVSSLFANHDRGHEVAKVIWENQASATASLDAITRHSDRPADASSVGPSGTAGGSRFRARGGRRGSASTALAWRRITATCKRDAPAGR